MPPQARRAPYRHAGAHALPNSSGMVNGVLPDGGGRMASPRNAPVDSRLRSVGTHSRSGASLIAYISLTMKIVRILGKVSENLILTCAKSTAPNELRLQAALLASPQPREKRRGGQEAGSCSFFCARRS